MLDYSEIQKQFDKVIEHSQGFKPHTDELFEQWAKNKKFFYNKFGNQLIKEFGEVEVAVNIEEIDKLYNQFKAIIREKVYNEKSAFVLSNTSPCYNFLSHIEPYEFFENRIVNENDNYPEITKNMRITTAIKKLELDKKKAEQLINIMSVYIQKRSGIKGILCFSIHPLDFLSLSDNAHRWRSCHALDGEFCSGNLSYMGDSSTFVIYIRSINDCKIANFPELVKWNSKKIRVLGHVDNRHECVFLNKMYPYSSTELEDIIANNIKTNLLHNCNFYKHLASKHDTYITKFCTTKCNEVESAADYGAKICLLSCYKPYNFLEHVDFCGMQYNDWCDNETFYPTIIGVINDLEKARWEIGSAVSCLHCGESLIYEHEIMVCEDCIREINIDKAATLGFLSEEEEEKYRKGRL